MVYKTTPQGPLKLDLHYPEPPKPGAKYPLVVFTHGGGWAAGSKTICYESVEGRGVRALIDQGFCVASVGYRLCTKDGGIVIRDCVFHDRGRREILRLFWHHAQTLSEPAMLVEAAI